MDTNLTETLETQPAPSDSLDFDPNPVNSWPNSPSHDQTLGDPSNSSSVTAELGLEDFTNELSHSRDGNPNPSVSVQFLDAESQEEEEQDLPSVSSPGIRYSEFSHWATPWSLAGVSKPEPPLPVEALPYEFPWSDDWDWRDETESKRSTVAGLSNLGNTCFLNAILQCFTHTLPLIQGVLSCSHVPCDRDFDGFCALCAFRDHIEASLASPTTVYPRRFVDNLNYFSSGFRRFQQEDAHEFLQCFLDRLESCCNSLKTKDTSSSSQDDNFVKQGFGGRLVSKLRCCNCYHCSDTYEPSIDLSLEIEDVSTLQSALESFTKVEKLEDTDIKFTCENCKEEVSVEKQLMLEAAPSVAALHLKRFKHDGAFVEKIDKDVEFPLVLDLEPYTSGNQTNHEELKYNLYAVVVHIGYSSTSGHYYCFIRYAPDTWYKFDDSKVTRVREEYVLSQEAYILFYAKQGTPWFSNFMETQNPSSIEPETSVNTSPKSVLDNVDRVSTSSSNLPDNNHNNNCDVDQISDASNEISREPFNGSRSDRFEGIEVKDDDSQRIYGPLPLRESNSSSHGTSFQVQKKKSPSKREFGQVNDDHFNLLTPSRSPSLDNTYEEDPQEVGFYNTRNRVRSVDQVNSKRQFNNKNFLEEDPEQKQACKLLKTLPGSRGSRLLAAMKWSLSEGPFNKKKKKKKKSRRSEMSPRTADNSPSSARRDPKFRFIPRPLAASTFR